MRIEDKIKDHLHTVSDERIKLYIGEEYHKFLSNIKYRYLIAGYVMVEDGNLTEHELTQYSNAISTLQILNMTITEREALRMILDSTPAERIFKFIQTTEKDVPKILASMAHKQFYPSTEYMLTEYDRIDVCALLV